MRILDATTDDLPAIVAIYNDAVANTTALWTDEPVDLANRRAWFQRHADQGHAIIAARDADGLTVGYASLGAWRPWDGYRHTVEHSVYVRADQRGKGVGHLLLRALVERARTAGRHVMVAGIEGGNEASLRLHARLGFVEVGRLREVGTKFGRWLDLVFMQLALDARKSAESTP